VTIANVEQPTGNGLGLAIVKSIMKLHHGTAEISSILGRGTTISLHFAK
jgi:signal transduction histidine kinase